MRQLLLATAILATLCACGSGDEDSDVEGLARPQPATFETAVRAMDAVDGRVKSVIPIDVLGQDVCVALRDGGSQEKAEGRVREQIARFQESSPQKFEVTDELAGAIVNVYRGQYCEEWARASAAATVPTE